MEVEQVHANLRKIRQLDHFDHIGQLNQLPLVQIITAVVVDNLEGDLVDSGHQTESEQGNGVIAPEVEDLLEGQQLLRGGLLVADVLEEVPDEAEVFLEYDEDVEALDDFWEKVFLLELVNFLDHCQEEVHALDSVEEDFYELQKTADVGLGVFVLEEIEDYLLREGRVVEFLDYVGDEPDDVIVNLLILVVQNLNKVLQVIQVPFVNDVEDLIIPVQNELNRLRVSVAHFSERELQKVVVLVGVDLGPVAKEHVEGGKVADQEIVEVDDELADARFGLLVVAGDDLHGVEEDLLDGVVLGLLGLLSPRDLVGADVDQLDEFVGDEY